MEQDLGYRKIQRVGRGSYIISLPREWVVNSGLEKGSQLAFKVEEDSSLLLVPRKVLEASEKVKSALKEYTIHITGEEEPQVIARKITSLYVISAESIRVRYKTREITPEQRDAIKNTVRMLLGSEIISETANEITIQVLINHPAFSIENAIRRMYAIAIIMDKNAISCVKNYDQKIIQDVLDSDYDLDRLSLYIIRQLKYGIEHNLTTEMGFNSPKEFLGYRIVTKNLENVGDNAVGTAKNILALKQMINQNELFLRDPLDEEAYLGVLRFASMCQDLLEKSLTALFKREYQMADQAISQFSSVGLELEKETVNLVLSKRMDPNVASVLRLVLDNARKMMEYARDIAEVALHRTVEEVSVS